MHETQWMERTRLARERSMLAMIAIAALLAAQVHTAFGIAAAGLRAHSPRELALATVLASVCAVAIVAV